MSFLGNLGDSITGGFKAVNDGSFKNPFKGITEGVGSIKTGISGPPPPPPATTASDIYANLTREQWANYVNVFQPIENQLIQYATDKSLPGQAMQEARTDVDNAYSTQAGQQARKLQGMGIALDPSEQAATTRATGLSHALASVQAQNTARDLTIGNQQSILGNPAPTTSSIAQQAAGLGV
jgi:hypothetical protein